MVVDNANYAVKNKLTRMAIIVGMSAIIALLVMLPEFDKWAGFSRYIAVAIVFISCASWSTYRYFRKLCFVYFSTDVGKITIRYYHLTTALKKYRAFEFPLAEFWKYELVKNGIAQDLIIYRKEGNKITKYPPVSITALKKNELEKIENALVNISSKNAR